MILLVSLFIDKAVNIKDQNKKVKISQRIEITTFPVPFSLKEVIENIALNKNTLSNLSKQELINQALDFYSKGNIHEATKSHKYCLEKGFEDLRILVNYGIICKELGQIDKAIKLYQRAIILFPKSAEAYSNLGNLYKDLGDLNKAEDFIRKSISLSPNFANAHSNLASILSELGKLKEAEASIRKAIKINPNHYMAYTNLGGILMSQGKLKEAEISTLKAIKITPSEAIAHSNLGAILKSQGLYEQAEISARKAIEIEPLDAEFNYNLGTILKDRNKLIDAEIFTQKAITLNPNYAEAYLNLGSIKSDLGKLDEAEISTRKAIKLNPSVAECYYNLGEILTDLGKLSEAKRSFLKAIKLNPNFVKSYYALSRFNTLASNQFINFLFSDSILDNKSLEDKIDIYFARANIFHSKKKFKESARNLQLANQMKLSINPCRLDSFIQSSKDLLENVSFEEQIVNQKISSSQSIFIVGMPRSGSSLLELILSCNREVVDLGETNIFEESFLEWESLRRDDISQSLHEIYNFKVLDIVNQASITTNKWLYNYKYSGIIASQLANSKIIHCYRNPLDNILSIFRTNFARGNQYSSSLEDCARVYLDHDYIMTKYKNLFRTKIYDLNYDLLVADPLNEILSLIRWLGWDWNDSYLSPHLNSRSVSTASNIQVRSPINSKSIGGWKNYRDMLRPAIGILAKSPRYTELTS